MLHETKPNNAPKTDLAKAPEPAKSSAAKAAAATKGDFAAQEQALAPAAAPAKSPDRLPASTEELRADATYKIAAGGSFTGKAIPPALGALLMRGIAAEGVSDAKTLDQAIADYLDGGHLNVSTVATPTGATLTWLSFTAGDTEVGYMFAGGALKAIVSDGWINAT